MDELKFFLLISVSLETIVFVDNLYAVRSDYDGLVNLHQSRHIRILMCYPGIQYFIRCITEFASFCFEHGPTHAHILI